VGNAVMDVITAPGFLKEVAEKGDYLGGAMQGLVAKYPAILAEVRGKGLMRGLKVQGDVAEFVAKLREQGLLSVPAADQTIRIVPPLTVTTAEIDEAVKKIEGACLALQAKAA